MCHCERAIGIMQQPVVVDISIMMKYILIAVRIHFMLII